MSRTLPNGIQLALSGLAALGVGSELIPHALAVTPNYCVGTLTGTGTPTSKYANRGTRCEGLYVRPNSEGDPLTLVSLTLASDQQPVGGMAAQALPLTWQKGVTTNWGSELTIHAATDPGANHYRMDTLVPAAQGNYQWPNDVLQTLHLAPGDLFVVACSGHNLCDRASSFVPVQVGHLNAAATKYRVRVIPVSQVDTVNYDIAQDVSGAWKSVGGAPLTVALKLAGNAFDVDIPLSAFPTKGTAYRITVSAYKAVKKAQKVSTVLGTDFRIYHG